MVQVDVVCCSCASPLMPEQLFALLVGRQGCLDHVQGVHRGRLGVHHAAVWHTAAIL